MTKEKQKSRFVAVGVAGALLVLVLAGVSAGVLSYTAAFSPHTTPLDGAGERVEAEVGSDEGSGGEEAGGREQSAQSAAGLQESVLPLSAATALPSELPLARLGFAGGGEYQRLETLESWRTTSETSCADYARQALETLYAEGFELVQAGFMDVSGECWSCVFRGKQEESLALTLIPEHPFSPRSANNRLVVSLTQYLYLPEEGLE